MNTSMKKIRQALAKCVPGSSLFRKQWLSLGLMAFLMLALFLTTTPAAAQDPDRSVSDDDVNEIAKELYCPVCESTPLDVCATQACADWREVIRTKLGEGQSEEDIKAYFELQYGTRALADPPKRGLTLTIWLLPVFAVVVGGLIFARYIRGIRHSNTDEVALEASSAAPVAQAEAPKLSESDQDDYEARIERELREM